MNSKPFYMSSTLWINALGVVAVILKLVTDLKLIPDADVMAIIVAVLNILNRFRITSTSEVKTLTLK